MLGASAGRWPGEGTSVRFKFEAPNHAVGELVAGLVVPFTMRATWESGLSSLNRSIGEPGGTVARRLYCTFQDPHARNLGWQSKYRL